MVRLSLAFLRAAVLPLALALSACGGGGGGGGGGVTAPAAVTYYARFAYAANKNSNTVSEYFVDPTTGQLRENGYVATGLNPSAVAVDPFGRYAYVTNQSSGTVA